MRGERALLHIGEYLVGLACHRLPRAARTDRYREWAAELPAILHDPGTRFAPRRAVRMLGYAADTLRGAALAPGPGHRRPIVLSTLWFGLVFVAGVVFMVWSVQDTVRTPENWMNYVNVAWSPFLIAWSVSQYFRSTKRGLISAAYCPAGVTFFVCHAVQGQGDWADCLAAAICFVPVLLWLIWPEGPTVRRKAGTPGSS